jgi:hypothetical protein
VGLPEGKRTLVTPRHRQKDNIKNDFKRWDWRTWIGLIWLSIRTGGRLL